MEHIKKELKKRLTVDRFEHVLRVAEYAKELAVKHNVAVHDAEQAALLHDIAKCMDKKTLRYLLEEGHGDLRLLDFHHELWHGPVGAMIAEEEFGVTDAHVLNAIRYHTTGRANMSTLEKLIFVADLVEPWRRFPGAEKIRQIANESIDAAMEASICHSIAYLISKRVAIYPDSFECYNEFMKLTN